MKNRTSSFKRRRLLANFLGYQIIWFFTVWCIQKNLFFLPLLMTALYICSHFYISDHKRTDLITIGSVSMIGIITDMVLLKLEILQLNTSQPLLINIPYWLIGIWLAFSQLLPYSLNWISRKKTIAILGGAIFGPLAYTSAIKLDLLSTKNLFSTNIVLSIVWAILMYVFIKIIQKTGGSNDRIK